MAIVLCWSARIDSAVTLCYDGGPQQEGPGGPPRHIFMWCGGPPYNSYFGLSFTLQPTTLNVRFGSIQIKFLCFF